MTTTQTQFDEFDPLRLVEDAINSGFDPALASEIDERELNWCPNIFTWITDPGYQDVTTIYPTQLQVLLRLHGDVCPWCSDWEFYSKDFDVLETMGNIQDRIQLLNFGKCPKCGKTRLDQYKENYWTFPNELSLLWGMRCCPDNSLVFTARGLVSLKDVAVGDILTHGVTTKKFDSGTLPSLKLTTEHNWTLTGAKETHIVPVLTTELELKYKLLKECKVGEYLIIHSPNLWPTSWYILENSDIAFTPEMAKKTNNDDYVPDCILRSPKCVVEAYLTETLRELPSEFDSYSSTSKLKTEQLRLLLLNLNIFTSLEEIDGVYTLTRKLISSSAAGNFIVQIKDIQDGPDLPMMDVHIPETNVYTADGFVHHNSGKSAIAGLLASYHLHRFLKIPDPASYYNLLKGSLLVMRFVALTAGQANESIWNQFVRSVDTCAWFSQYHDFLKHHEKRLGVELNKWMTQSFGYTHKKITGYYLGASIDTSRGRTAIGSFFDEIGWWLGTEQAKRANAAETYQAYQKASRTIRNEAAERFLKGHYDIPTAIMTAVSSTSSKTDFMMHLIRLGKKDTRRVCSHKASWEVNPKFAQNPDELAAERESNYKTYLRDYGSVPPYSSDPFFDNENLVTRLAMLPRPEWPIIVEKGTVGLYLSAQHVPKDSTIPYCLAVDLGYNKCGFAIALLKLKEADFSAIQIAGLWGIYPSKEKNEVVDMSMCFTHFIKRLCEIFPIKLVVYDQWQSKTQIQELMNMGIKAEQYSLSYKDFVDFRSQVIQAKLEVPEPELTLTDVDKSSDDILDILHRHPYLHLIWQMLSVSEIGNKVCKGDGDDDLFRAVVLGASYLWDDDYRKDFEYKKGMYIGGQRSGKGRLAMAGGSMSSGQMFSTSSAMGGGYNPTVATAITNNRGVRPIGAIIPRGGK